VAPKLSAVVSCEFCGWTIRHSADDAHEITTFLRAQLIAHVSERHPERFPKERQS
jgi:hypothetical protein